MLKTKTRDLRAGAVFGVMGVLTPKLRDGVKDWLTYRTKTPRPFTLFLKRNFGEKHLVGAEIGFGYGFNALSLLEELNIETLYCIDPLKAYVNKFGQYEDKYLDENGSLFPMLSKDPRVHFVKLESDKAFDSKEIPHDLDFVYVDGLHTSEQAYRDIMNALNQVKAGGTVGGHDFTREYEDTVLPAVFRVSAQTGMVPTVDMPDFWFIKDAISEK
jgi:hypothetical protein